MHWCFTDEYRRPTIPHNFGGVNSCANYPQPHFSSWQYLLLPIARHIAGLMGRLKFKVFGYQVVGHEHLQGPSISEEAHLHTNREVGEDGPLTRTGM
jgi:hypothetical protein